jgi:hypothetical protein
MKAFADKHWRYLVLLIGVTVILLPVAGEASLTHFYSLRMAAVQVFDGYVARTNAQNSASIGDGHFLWPDTLDHQQRSDAYTKLKSGGVEMQRVLPESGGQGKDVPGGMIHDWKGIVFIPGVKLEDVLKILQDYDHHSRYYAPDVQQAKIESRDGDHFKVFMRFRREKVVTVVLDTEQDVNYFRDSLTRAHSRSSATRIAQVDNPDTAEEREKKPGDDDGFLWRMETWWRMEERDGGVYVQNEVVSLTRNIPMGLAWIVEPFVTKIPKETLEFTLQSTRKAVLDRRNRQP